MKKARASVSEVGVVSLALVNERLSLSLRQQDGLIGLESMGGLLRGVHGS